MDDCNVNNRIPNGGYKYPKHKNIADSGFIFVQIKDSLDKRDSFIWAYRGYHYFKSFDEPNLSLHYSGKTLFRITYDTWALLTFVVTISCDQITMKIGESGTPYPLEDTSKLNKKEQLIYNIYQIGFPIDTTKISRKRITYLDSLIKIYSDMLSSSYIRSILEKSLNYDSINFKYSTHHVNITKEKFKYFINRINESGFWDMPNMMKYTPEPTDGDGYTFEAHTPKGFKFVVSSNCPEISSKLTEVCQEIIDFAKPTDKKLILCNNNGG